ncbi:MAG: CRTAC1 family protein [Acidobacteriota bacterium]
MSQRCRCAMIWLLAVLLTSTAWAGSNGSFSDQTVTSLVAATYSGSNVHGFHGGGVVGDFNNDGWQDIFFAGGGGSGDKLFINNQDGTFSEEAAAWGIALVHRSTAAAVGDFNRDGWLDLYVTSLGPDTGNQIGFHKLYRNNGNDTFTDVAVAAGVAQSSAISADGWGAAWGDYDLDGDLDLAVAGWSTNDGNRLFRNNDDGTFTDVTTSAGLSSLTGTNGFAPRFVDMDDDRYPELIWIGDFASGHYYANDGDGTFTDVTLTSNTNQDTTEMGMTIADWNEDGVFDFYVTTISTNNLYLNQGNNVYVNVAGAAGVADTGWGWATAAIDFNHDTLVDIVATAQNGRNYAFVNTTTEGGGPNFSEVATSNGLGIAIDGRGLANVDYDNDGDQDVVVFPHSGSVKVMRNDLSGVDTNWLRVFLDPNGVEDIAPNGIGAVIEVHLGARVLMGRIDGGSNYLSQSEMSAHFGLGGATSVDELRVRWPNGAVTVLTNVAVNQTLTIAALAAVFEDGFESGDVGAWSSAVP